MQMRSRRLGVAAGLVLLTLAQVGWAGEFNNRLLATGERSSGMGGAYVALSDDDTGMLHNPAGLAHANTGAPAATVNVVSGSSTRYDDVFGSTNWSRDSLGIVPSFFGVATTSGNWVFGGSVVVTDFYDEDQTDQFRNVRIGTTTYDELRVHNDSTGRAYNLGLTLTRKWPKSGWSLGASGYFHYAERDRSFTQRLSRDADLSTVQDDTTILVQVQQDDKTLGFKPVLGLLYRNSWGSLGLSVSQLFLFDREYFYAFGGDVVTPTDGLSFDLIDVSDDYEDQPLLVSLGFARFLPGQTTLSFQVDYTEERKVDLANVPGGLPPRDLDTQAVVNVSAGLEKTLSQQWLMRAGIYTDFANNKAKESALFERREEIDVYGASLSFSRKRDKGYWTLGLDFAYGNGEATLGDLGFGTTEGIERVDASKLSYNLLVSTTW